MPSFKSHNFVWCPSFNALRQKYFRIHHKVCLLLIYLGSQARLVRAVDKNAALPSGYPHRLKTKPMTFHFWAPHATAGAVQIIFSLREFFSKLERYGFQISVSDELPTASVDVLVSFKAIPPSGCSSYSVLLICDQAELFWSELRVFDEVIVTSSYELQLLIGYRHPSVSMISEFEPSWNIEKGRLRLQLPEGSRSKVFWHGGHYSFNELEPYLPIIESLMDDGDCDGLVIVSGEQAETTYDLGTIPVWHFPWSYANLSRAASECRLALLPARRKLKHSFLKPASRVRCAFSLGIYALGDGRTPEVRRFASKVGAKVLTGNLKSDAEMIRSCWYNSSLLETVEKAISEIERNHSQVAIESMWLDWFERTARKL